MLETYLSKSKFSIDNGPLFEGYYDPARKWNGWDCPRFVWGEVIKIADWLNVFHNHHDILRIDEKNHVVICLEEPDNPFEIASRAFQTADGEKQLYSVGSGWWIWEEVSF